MLVRLSLDYYTLDVTMPGNPQIFAEAKLNLIGFNQAVDGEWIVNRAEHTLNSSGYLTMLSASLSK
ncbi:hypothetical protein [Wolbachia endosymbiont of Leptopilina clavipes]|uniref:hypothetical protein n=1 Tax=Wolbachia endosymbiont of Leptopilina clavipes TaxID=260213 RepID=UPI001FE35FEB|nr:hypothetical protein [Wolbachia endosymbiont of Leptopilina clavipes]